MHSLAERVSLLLERLDGPAVPLPELVRLLRESGVAVSEPVLIRSLTAEPERFRVLHPGRCLRASPSRAQLPWAQWSWVVPPVQASPGAPAALRRMRAGLVRLGWQVDASSVTDLARWFGMVMEAERLRARLPVPVRRDAPALSPSVAAAASATPRLRPPPRATAGGSWRGPAGDRNRLPAARSG